MILLLSREKKTGERDTKRNDTPQMDNKTGCLTMRTDLTVIAQHDSTLNRRYKNRKWMEINIHSDDRIFCYWRCFFSLAIQTEFLMEWNVYIDILVSSLFCCCLKLMPLQAQTGMTRYSFVIVMCKVFFIHYYLLVKISPTILLFAFVTIFRSSKRNFSTKFTRKKTRNNNNIWLYL